MCSCVMTFILLVVFAAPLASAIGQSEEACSSATTSHHVVDGVMLRTDVAKEGEGQKLDDIPARESDALNLLQTKMAVTRNVTQISSLSASESKADPEFKYGIDLSNGPAGRFKDPACTASNRCKCFNGAPGPRTGFTYEKNMCCPEGYEEVKTEGDCQRAAKMIPIAKDWRGKNVWGGTLKRGGDRRPGGCILMRTKHNVENTVYFNPAATSSGRQRGVDKVICQKSGAGGGGGGGSGGGGGGGATASKYTGEMKKAYEAGYAKGDEAQKKARDAYDEGYDEGYEDAEEEWEDE
eukprot:gnl/TRDRNA2_/TRDRNA2_55360_c0_seq1.p1 gnl/TRDRNA2_/TRDRNA2_55360_c0~~gnl/TRDRNA2_/TRDRNA2_55360_c0_seq1.p1  ORF type:complete len:295 (+),score=54.51 gnl/TRDRNA2_/TRDRNA2_55360_c0_seq1:36-920(+)